MIRVCVWMGDGAGVLDGAQGGGRQGHLGACLRNLLLQHQQRHFAFGRPPGAGPTEPAVWPPSHSSFIDTPIVFEYHSLM